MNDSDRLDDNEPASQPKDTRKMSQIARDESERMAKVADEWVEFEGAEALRERRLRQAGFLGVALWIKGAKVPEKWREIMEVAAAQHEASDGGEEKKAEPEDQTWLVSKEQLEADGWRFEEGQLHTPPKV